MSSFGGFTCPACGRHFTASIPMVGPRVDIKPMVISRCGCGGRLHEYHTHIPGQSRVHTENHSSPERAAEVHVQWWSDPWLGFGTVPVWVQGLEEEGLYNVEVELIYDDSPYLRCNRTVYTAKKVED